MDTTTLVLLILAGIGALMTGISYAFMSHDKLRTAIIMVFSFALFYLSMLIVIALYHIEASNTQTANVINVFESFINQNFDGTLPSEMWEMRRERSYQGFNPRPVYSEYRMALTGEFHREFQIWLSANEITLNTNDITRLINNGRLDLRQFVG